MRNPGKTENKNQQITIPSHRKYSHHSVREDKKWYYMAPVLMDGSVYVSRWINEMTSIGPDGDDTTEDAGTRGLFTHLQRLNSMMHSAETEMGKPPEDLEDILVDMAIGSFAVCAFRSNGGDSKRSSELAKIFINRFNSTEATALIL